MSILLPVNIIFALILYPMFISNYQNLFLFLIDALVSLYEIFNYLGLLK